MAPRASTFRVGDRVVGCGDETADVGATGTVEHVRLYDVRDTDEDYEMLKMHGVHDDSVGVRWDEPIQVGADTSTFTWVEPEDIELLLPEAP